MVSPAKGSGRRLAGTVAVRTTHANAAVATTDGTALWVVVIAVFDRTRDFAATFTFGAFGFWWHMAFQ